VISRRYCHTGLRCLAIFLVSFSTYTVLAQGNNQISDDPLIQILIRKGVLDDHDSKALTSLGSDAKRSALLKLLCDKGVISSSDYKELTASPVDHPPVPRIPSPSLTTAVPQRDQALVIGDRAKLIPAVAPIRTLQVEPVAQNGVIPDIKLGSGAKLKLYGMVKATLIHDTSSPYGADMPMPAFIGPTFDPGITGGREFHAKARFARLGTNFEWPAGERTSITGKLEFDFEGNFTRALNRNISTIRSSQPSIRLAYGRIDHRFDQSNSAFALFGQDWTPFGSSTLPSLFETTGVGLGFGTLYERAPQFRFGVGHRTASSRGFYFQPELAFVMPAFGNDPKLVDNQLGYGERQGADSSRPELQARFVTQWQFDRAPGVAPAQLIFSGVQGRRSALVRYKDVPSTHQAAFPNGAEVGSDRYGWTAELQLPTRFVTVLAKYWNGADLRFYFVGSLFSNFNDATIFDAGTPVTEAPSDDGASTVLFGLRNGVPAVAPQRPIRSQGGFINLGFPLSRIFDADPSGRNAGWLMYLHYAYDAAKPSDVRRVGNERQKNDLGALTLCYRLSNWITFTLEESYYRTRAVGDPTGQKPYPLYRGYPAREWHDLRSEVGPTFSF